MEPCAGGKLETGLTNIIFLLCYSETSICHVFAAMEWGIAESCKLDCQSKVSYIMVSTAPSKPSPGIPRHCLSSGKGAQLLRLHTARNAPAHSTPSAACEPHLTASKAAGVVPISTSPLRMMSSAEMPTIYAKGSISNCSIAPACAFPCHPFHAVEFLICMQQNM